MAEYSKQRVKCLDCGIEHIVVRRNKAGKFKRCEDCTRKIDYKKSKLQRLSKKMQ